MEIEPVSYIFGSFSRRKSSHQSHLQSQSKSSVDKFENKKISNPQAFSVAGVKGQLNFHTDETSFKGKHVHSKSQPETGNVEKNNCDSKKAFDRSSRSKSCTLTLKPHLDKNLLPATCPICNHVFLEPRVLQCLHSFCTRCLQVIIENKGDESEVWIPKEEYDTNVSLEIFNNVTCPVCKEKTPLNRQGIYGLPPNYIIQHRLVLATLNDENTKLLCDLCSGDIVATHRCSNCLVNLCDICTNIHQRHQSTLNHELLLLREARRQGIMQIHRQIMCQIHPEHELVAYCFTCAQTICAMCLSIHHSKEHEFQPCSAAALGHSSRLRKLLLRARSTATKSTTMRHRLAAVRRVVESRCRCVQLQVECFIEEYKKAVENHRNKMLQEIENIRTSLLSDLNVFETDLKTHLQNSSTAINFSQSLLEEGSDVELLTFVAKLLKKLEDLEQPVNMPEELKDLLQQVGRDRNSKQEGLVDFIPVKRFENELEKNDEISNNSVRTQKPLRHVLVDFRENRSRDKEISKMSHEELLPVRSVSWNDDVGLKKMYEGFYKKNSNLDLNNKLNKIEESKENDSSKKFCMKHSSVNRKSGYSVNQKGILNQLRNCLENHETTVKTPPSISKSSNNENSSLHSYSISESEFDKSLTSENLRLSNQSINQILSTNEAIVLEFLPLEPDTCTEGSFPIIYGQIRRVDSTNSETGNCCSAQRPHLGGIPVRKSKQCPTQSNPNRKSDLNGKVYQFTL